MDLTSSAHPSVYHKKMQSELLSQIHGIFSGKCHRKIQVITTLQTRRKQEGKTPFSNRFKKHFRRKRENAADARIKKHKKDGGGSTVGKSRLRVCKIDFKLNLKRINFSNSPPAVPARHFSIDNVDDLPPPIPERKLSLDTSVDEELQGRFIFRPMSLVPLPERFSNCKKLYPSQTAKEYALQRPLSQPPPPPPPVDYDLSPMETAIFYLPLPDVTSLQPPLTNSDTHSPDLLPVVGNKPKLLVKNLHQILANDGPNATSDLPPPPTRKVPPPPSISATKNIKLSTFATSPAAPILPATISSEIQPKQNGSHQPGTLLHPKINKTQATSDQYIIPDLNQSPSMPPFSPPPPPLSVRPGFSQAATKPKLANGSQNRTVLKQTPSITPSAILPAHVVMKYKELPQLPVKPSHKSPILPEAKTLPLLPQTAMGVNKNDLNSLPQRAALSLPQQPPPLPTKQQSQHPTQPQFSSAPSLSQRPQPDLVSSICHPNKHRPLPSIPISSLAKKVQPPKSNDGWGGAEVYDPREEEGDIYDIMESTDM